MARPFIECVPNFSEGRDANVVAAIAAAIACVPGVAVLGTTMDFDHHRSVVTFAGSPEGVSQAAYRAVACAVERIDLRRHTGVHPRIGAADVVPFVPVAGVTMADCVRIAEETGERIWAGLGVPVYLYEAAARTENRKKLEDVRRGGLEALAGRTPDFGNIPLHPTAGACIVGARKFLIAFNINLATDDLSLAQSIARRIRASSGGFPHVKALGLRLASQGLVQVSMNLTDYEATPLETVYAAVAAAAREQGADVAGSELIGLIPEKAALGAAGILRTCAGFTPDAILENRLASALRR